MTHTELIAALGGTFAVAELVGIRPPSVSEWKQRGTIPQDKLMRLATIAEARGISSRKELFPDSWQAIWPELAATDHRAPTLETIEAKAA